MKQFLLLLCVVVVSTFAQAADLGGHKLLITSIRTGDTEVCIADRVTGDLVNVTRSPQSEDRYPCWSPDGSQICFSSDREGTTNLWICNADGSQLRRLNRTSAVCYMPSWGKTPDGERIVFGKHGDKPEMASIRPDGDGELILGDGHDPTLSPDGKLICYTGHPPEGGVTVYVMDWTGSNKRRVVTTASQVGATFPNWSPDGQQLVYSFPVDDALELFLINTDGTHNRQLTRFGGTSVCTPSAWSPDGGWISFRRTDERYWSNPERMKEIYTRKPADKRPVWVIHPDGTEATLIESLRYQMAIDGSRASWKPQSPRPTLPLKVSENHRYIVDAAGKPFFWLGDTAWELFHRLNREEAERYLRNRAAKGFTVIQAVALAELDGLNTPNAYGHRPFIENDPVRPDLKDGPANDYWDQVDFVLEKAAELGLHIGLLPTWGDKWQASRGGKGPVVFNPDNARIYGEWLGRRYKDKPVIWILGGDCNIESGPDRAIMEAMAHGLRAGDSGQHLITYHPRGPGRSSDYFHTAGWLDLNMTQSSHAARDHDNGLFIAHDYALQPPKPTFDGEPRYERIPVGFYLSGASKHLTFDDYDCRQAAYWALLAGACGHTYGNNNIWQMWAPGRMAVIDANIPWQEALDHPGAFQMGYLRRLFESRPFIKLVPDDTIVVDGPRYGGAKVRAARASDHSFAFIYSPRGEPFTVRLDTIESKRGVNTWWFDPRYGTATALYTGDNVALQTFTPPSQGRGQDWLLVLDDAAKAYPKPGAEGYRQ